MTTTDLSDDHVTASNLKNLAAAKRSELDDTLDAIEDKLNIPKQAGILVEKAKTSYELNPVPWFVGAAAAVVVVGGLIAWALFGDD